MAENTTIEWATHSFNPWIGCSHVHTGCDHCYAEAQAGRHGVKWGPDGTRRKTSEAYWKKPLTWNKRAAQSGECPRVFSSLCDSFEDFAGFVLDSSGRAMMHVINGDKSAPSIQVAEKWLNSGHGCSKVTLDDLRRDFFQLIDKTQNLDWLLLTKRPENVRRMWSGRWALPTNIWLGVSISDQETADKLIPELLKLRDLTPCLFVSVEPLVASFDLAAWIAELDWCIVGGESGPHARPCRVEWIRWVTGDCERAGVPCFVKQLGRRPTSESEPAWAQGWSCSDDEPYDIILQHPKGGDPTEWPDDLRIRDLPEV